MYIHVFQLLLSYTETPLSVPEITPPSQVQGVILSGSGTSLTVSWTAVTHQIYNISYVVNYSTKPGNETDPPSDAMKRSGITATSTTLTELQLNTTYYVWVAAEILGAGVQGPYSMRTSTSGNERGNYSVRVPIIAYSGSESNFCARSSSIYNTA